MQVGWAEVAILSKYLVRQEILRMRYHQINIVIVMVIGVFLGHFRINLHQTCTQYSNEGPQH